MQNQTKALREWEKSDQLVGYRQDVQSKRMLLMLMVNRMLMELDTEGWGDFQVKVKLVSMKRGSMGSFFEGRVEAGRMGYFLKCKE